MRTLARILHRAFLRVARLAARYLRRSFRGTVRYARVRRRDPAIREKTVLFEAYRAVKIADTPYAMFKEMITDPFYRDYTFIWAIDDTRSRYRRELSRYPNVRFVKFHSRAYVKALYTAKYVVNNKAWPSYFAKRPGQVHVTTWHATAFKALGKEQGGTIGQFKNITRNYLQADYLVMPNRFTSEVMLRSNDVKGIFPGVVLEEGYPRLDLTVKADRGQMLELLVEVCGVDPAKKIVLYAPTWRGETGGYLDTTDEAVANVEALAERLPDDYELILKVHDLTYRHLVGRDDLLSIKFVPDWVETNELLAAVDILITDYSSIFIDLLVLDRPVIFFAYDLEEYTADRGLYFDMREMPGPLCHTAAEVVDAILDIESVQERYAGAYAAMREELCPGADGKASARVCDIIFKGQASESVYRSFDSEKQRILVAGGTFGRTRQTFDIINFSRNLDYSRYDLTILLSARVTRERERHLRKLDPRARVFYSFGFRALTLREYLYRMKHWPKTPAERCAPDEIERMRPLFEIEKRRLIGDTPYDAVITFTDRLSEWTYLMSVCELGRRIMWLSASTVDQTKRLPGDFVAERFDRVFVTPGLAGHPIVQEIRAAEGRQGVEGDESVLSEIERLSGFGTSIDSLGTEVAEQLDARVRELAASSADPAAQDSERVRSVVRSMLESVTTGLAAHVERVHRAHGLDPRLHDSATMERFYIEMHSAGGGLAAGDERGENH